MRSTYRVLAFVIAIGVAIQAASVALAFFTILHEVDDGGAFTADYDYESNLGIMIHRVGGLGLVPLSALALLIVSFFTRVPGAVKWAAAVFGLVVLQIALVFAAFANASVGALHGMNALAVFLTAIWAGRRITRVSEQDERARDVAAA
jgi:glucan phosphoethanolaminetransferase (alkaline phosphatase superfamily)